MKVIRSFLLFLFFYIQISCSPITALKSSVGESSNEILDPNPGPQDPACQILNASSVLLQKTETDVLFRIYGEEKVNFEIFKNSEKKLLSVTYDRICFQNRKASQSKNIFSNLKGAPKVSNNFPGSTYYSETLEISHSVNLDQIKKDADQIDCIVGVSEEVLIEPSSLSNSNLPNDPLLQNQSYLNSVDYFSVYEKSFINPNSAFKNEYIVGVIDIGFMMDHPDLSNQWWINQNEIPNNNIDDDGNGIIDDVHGANFYYNPPLGDTTSISYQFHGTHVAGLIAAQTNNGIGISSIMGLKTKIMVLPVSMRIVGEPGSNETFGSAIANAIRYGTDNGANVINISMGKEGESPALESAMQYAASKNTTVVVSAGNNNRRIDETFKFIPAYYTKNIEGAISVAATNSQNGNLNPEACGFTNFSEDYVEFAAPGCDRSVFTDYGGNGVLSCISPDVHSSLYGYVQGTSMSSPVAAAGALWVYAMIKEKLKINPTSKMVETILTQGSLTNPLLSGKSKNQKHLNFKELDKFFTKLGNCRK